MTETSNNFIRGIDVSHRNSDGFNHPIDWKKVAATTTPDGPVRFVIAKITEGKDFNDMFGRGHAVGAFQVGIPYGFYHFARPGQNTGTEEANHFYSAVAGCGLRPNFRWPFALDLEHNYGLNPTRFLAWIEEFMSVFIGCFNPKKQPKMLIFSSKYFLDKYLPPTHTLGERFGLWIEHHNRNEEPELPVGWKEWAVWQYSWHNTIDGMVGPVDENFAR